MLWTHGLGISMCPARGRVQWNRDHEDFDGVECLVFLMMPIVPLRAVHVCRGPTPNPKADDEPRQYPIRWSAGLLFRAIYGRWLWSIFSLAIITFIAGLNAPRAHERAEASTVALIFVGVFVCSRWVLRRTDRRNRSIRLLLGQHHFGSSDPVHWKSWRFEKGSNPEVIYGTATYAEAVPLMLERGEYSRAMWAARLTCAVEDRYLGESLTNTVLADERVQEAITSVQENPRAWRRLMVGQA